MSTVQISSGVVHDLPADLRKAIAADAEARAAWEDITPLARNEWICWTISVKKGRDAAAACRKGGLGAEGRDAAAVLLAGMQASVSRAVATGAGRETRTIAGQETSGTTALERRS